MQDVALLTKQLSTLATGLEKAISSVESDQQHATDQDKRINALQEELEQEREARRVLTQQVQTLSLQRQRPRTSK